MGWFDDIVPPDSASSYFATPPGLPRITVRPKGVESPSAPLRLDDMPANVGLASDPFEPWSAGEGARGNVAPSPRTAGLFDDIVAPGAQHKATIERALSTTVPLRLQHSRPIEIAAGLMADHGMPLDEALDRATMRLHAEEGTAEAGKISDVIGKDAFDEAQRTPASPDLAPPAPGVGRGHAATQEQAGPDGEYASGDSAAQGGDAAGDRLSSQAISPIAEPTKSDSPYYDPMTGMPMSARPLPPQSPGLPIRSETRAPLRTPTADWRDSPVTPPRYGVPLAVPDPNALGEGFPAPSGPTAMDRIKAAAAHGFGDEPLGFSDENRAKYPSTFLRWQPFAAPLDFIRRAPGAAIGAISSAGSELYKTLGGTETDANRLERDLNILGQGAIIEGGVFGRYNIGKPQTNLLRTTEEMLSDEAAVAGRESIASMTPRAGPQPPARPLDTATAQPNPMTSKARESGPSSLEGVIVQNQGRFDGERAANTQNDRPPGILSPATISWEERRRLLFGQTDLFGGRDAGGRGAPPLPKFTPGGPTAGVFQAHAAGDKQLVSGWGGPASLIPRGSSGFNIVTRTHVEAHAAALMQQLGISRGTVYINNPLVCSSCEKLLPSMLPSGAELKVVLPNGAVVTFVGVVR